MDLAPLGGANDDALPGRTGSDANALLPTRLNWLASRRALESNIRSSLFVNYSKSARRCIVSWRLIADNLRLENETPKWREQRETDVSSPAGNALRATVSSALVH